MKYIHSGVFTNLVRHKDTLFEIIGSLVDETMKTCQEEMEQDTSKDSDTSVLKQLLRKVISGETNIKVSKDTFLSGDHKLKSTFCFLGREGRSSGLYHSRSRYDRQYGDIGHLCDRAEQKRSNETSSRTRFNFETGGGTHVGFNF